MKTLDQQRAAYAWHQLTAIRSNGLPNTVTGEQDDMNLLAGISREVHRLPAMIMTSGLGQSLAFLLAKAKGNESDPAYVVYNMIAVWLVKHRRMYTGEPNDLIVHLIEGDRQTYHHAQLETDKLLAWLKNFSKPFVAESKDEANVAR